TKIVTEQLLEGKIVRLGTIGTFRISLSSSGEETPNEVNFNNIKGSRVYFKPDKYFEKNLLGLSFEKAKDVQVNPIVDDSPAP
ncbi:MAG: hypothetical protein RIF46_14540, partial [Cyclobacteriaceae bacterium]